MKEFAISGVPHGKAMTTVQKAVLLQPTKFYAIPTSRLMISICFFLPCAMISGMRKSPERP